MSWIRLPWTISWIVARSWPYALLAMQVKSPRSSGETSITVSFDTEPCEREDVFTVYLQNRHVCNNSKQNTNCTFHLSFALAKLNIFRYEILRKRREIWHCVYYASYCNVLMTNEMHNSYNQFLFHSFCLLYMFQMHLVIHQQEHSIIYYIIQFGTIVL